MTQAALGASFDLDTLDGEERITVEPGTQPGHLLRLRGRGVPVLNGRGRGDLIVEINVEVPHKLSADEAELLGAVRRITRRGHRSARIGVLLQAAVRFRRSVSDTGWAAAAGATALAFVDVLPTGSEPVRLDGPDGHHLQRVRRLGIDERVVLADGRGRWVPTRVAVVADGTVDVVVTGSVLEEPVRAPELTVAFAPAKRDHGTEVTHQLVELGVDGIVPLRTERGVVRWDGERGAKHLDRLRRVAREAAMQCRRARIPEVDATVDPDGAGRPTGTRGRRSAGAYRSGGRHFRTETRGSCWSAPKAASRRTSSRRWATRLGSPWVRTSCAR